MPYPRFQRARTHKFAVRSTGDIPVVTTTFAALDATLLDLTLDAAIGDVIEIGLSASASHLTSGGLIAFDVGTISSTGAIVNRISGASEGVSAWRENRATGGEIAAISGSVFYSVGATDLVGTFITLRLLARTGSGTMNVHADGATRRLQVWAKNLGPVDPN